MFFSPPFSYSASLCEQLLAGGGGETPAYSFVGNFVECLNIYRIFLFEYMCITFCSNSGEEREITGQFEYMSYYLLLKLEPLGHAAPCSLNICRITFYLNFCREVIWSYWFECMSHYLLLKLKHEGIKG